MLSRRALFGAAGAAGAGGALALAGCTGESADPPFDPSDWASVRAQFRLPEIGRAHV